MSVRQSVLAILTLGPCYGYQLRTEYGRRTGGARDLNVGQIYNTLDRLERDGLAVKADTDAQGHVYFAITPAGRAAAEGWFAAPGDDLDGLAVKLALAASLPGVDAVALAVRE
ncbi:MAG: PadR family transcriptional regulator, partial [Microbacterium sp.]|uniref:PadR family transcriptional regulator n=1 Tax=Microbacterium sp. TaxID=51671 RepID=UPI0039E2AD26